MDLSEPLLTVLKLVFLGLIYLALFMVVITVRREMRQHIRNTHPSDLRTRGQLKVIQRGSDVRLQLGQMFSLQNRATLGADPSNDIVLNDTYVSNHHAQLYWNGAGWLVEDLGSTNGTLIDGQRCLPHEEQPIPVGASLRIGDVELQLL